MGLTLALLATVVWSGNFVTTRGMADNVPPVQAVFWRWIIATLAVAPSPPGRPGASGPLIRKHLGYVALAALFGVTLYNTLVHQAGLTTSASNMGMIMAASPVVMALFARLGGERLGARRTLRTAARRPRGAAPRRGRLPRLRLRRRRPVDVRRGPVLRHVQRAAQAQPAEIGQLAFLITTFVLGALMLAPAYAVSVTVQGGFEVTAGTVGPLLYVGVFSSAVAFFAWNKAISVIGAARAGVVYYLQPVCVAGLGFLLIGERTGPAQLLCMALILGGVGLGSARR